MMADGTVEKTGEQVTFRYERRLPQAIESVWQAITDPAEINQWMGTHPEIELRQGGHYVTHHQGGFRVVDRVLRVEPPRLFEHTFFEHVNPSAVVSWLISPTETGSLLVLAHVMSMDDVHAAMATVAAGDDPITILARNAAGWHHLLDLLQAYLNAETMTWSPDDQQALQQRYAALVG